MLDAVEWLTSEPLFRASRLRSRNDLPALNDITAQLRLAAHHSVWAAWQGVLKAEKALEWNWTEVYEQGEHGPVADETDKDVAAARTAYDRFAQAAKSDLGLQ